MCFPVALFKIRPRIIVGTFSYRSSYSEQNMDQADELWSLSLPKYFSLLSLNRQASIEDCGKRMTSFACNSGMLWTRGLSILQLVVLEGRWDTVMQCVW